MILWRGVKREEIGESGDTLEGSEERRDRGER